MRIGAARAAQYAIWLLLLVPVVIIPGGEDRFVYGKLLVAAVGVAFAWSAGATGRLEPLAARLLLAAAGVTVLSALFSDATAAALLGRGPFNEGIFVVSLYALAGLAGARLLGRRSPTKLTELALTVMAISALLVAGLAVLETFGLRPLSSDLDRPGSLLGNASDEGAFAVLYLGPLLIAALRRRQRVIIAGATAAALTAVLSASRGAFIGLAVVLVIAAVASGTRGRRVVVGGAGVAVVLMVVVPAVRHRLLNGYTAGSRLAMWREGLALLVHHPVLGVGPSGYENSIVARHSASWYQEVGAANPPAAPHNVLIQAGLIGGPVLLGLLIALVWRVMRAGRSVPQATDNGWALGSLTGLLGYGAALMFHFPSPGTMIPAVVLAGGLLAVEPVRGASGRVRQIERGAVVVAGVLALVFAFGSLAELYLHGADQAIASADFARADSDFSTARMLRPWDPDLPAGPFHQFVAAATGGQQAALAYAVSWEPRVSLVAGDEQVGENRAALHLALGDTGRARELLTPFLVKDPDNPQVLLLAGVIAGQQRHYDQALHYFRRAATMDPTNPRPWTDLAITYRVLGLTADAAHATAEAAKRGAP